MRAEKTLRLAEIKEQIQEAGSFVVITYEKVSANVANGFRNDVAKVGGAVEMVPKRMLLKAAEKAGVALESIAMPGHIGLIFAGKDEPFAIAKTVADFSKECDGVSIIGGRFEGKVCTAEQVNTISTLPSMDAMRAQILGLFEAPMAQTLSVMESLLTSVLYALEEKAKKDEGQ